MHLLVDGCFGGGCSKSTDDIINVPVVLPGMVSLGPVQITFLINTPFNVISSLHVPSRLVGFTYTKGSWWMVTIWGGGRSAGGERDRESAGSRVYLRRCYIYIWSLCFRIDRR